MKISSSKNIVRFSYIFNSQTLFGSRCCLVNVKFFEHLAIFLTVDIFSIFITWDVSWYVLICSIGFVLNIRRYKFFIYSALCISSFRYEMSIRTNKILICICWEDSGITLDPSNVLSSCLSWLTKNVVFDICNIILNNVHVESVCSSMRCTLRIFKNSV